MALMTNAGLNLWATSIQTGANAAVTYVSVGLGAGTLASPLTNGSPYTSLTLNIALAVNIPNGQSLTLIDSLGDTQVITASGTGNVVGALSITVNSFNANANYAANTTGVVNTPAVTDNTLQNEQWRLAASPGFAGASTGESLNSGYMDATAPTGVYLEVGYWGGSATSSLGSGTLMAKDVQYWNHVQNVDSANYQLDTTI